MLAPFEERPPGRESALVKEDEKFSTVRFPGQSVRSRRVQYAESSGWTGNDLPDRHRSVRLSKAK